MALQGAPVQVVASGGSPVVNTANGAPATVVDTAVAHQQATPVTVVSSGGAPVHLLNPDGTDWTP